MGERAAAAAKGRAFDALAPWVAGVALALPVVVLRFPPMRDLPLHEVVVSVLRHWGDAGYFPPGLYVHSFGMPNQLFFFLAWPLSYVVSVPMACKLVAAATIAAMPVVAARFARSQGRPGWVGVLAAPVMLGWLFVWGVIANMIGLVLLFAALPALDRWTLAPSPRSAAKTLGVLVLLDLAHEEVLVVAWLFVAMVALVARPPRAWLAWGSVVLSAGLALAQQLVIETLRTPESASNRSTYVFASLAQRFRVAPGMLFPGQDAFTRGAAWLVVLAPIGWLLTARVRASPPLGGSGSLGERLVRARFALFAGLLVVGYLVLPYDAGNSHLIFHRFLPPAFVLLVTLAAPRTSEWEAPRVLSWVSLAAPLAALAVVLPTSIECDQMFRHFETLLPRIEPGSALVALDTHSSGTELLRGLDLQGHAVALRGGRTFFDYTQSPTSPALLAKRSQWNDSTRRLLHGEDFRPAWDLKRYRYVFVHIARPEEIMSVRVALAPEAHFVDSAGDWMLFESNILSVPIDAPDAPLPSPAPPSFAEKYAGAGR
jgi:hypothetical protein